MAGTSASFVVFVGRVAPSSGLKTLFDLQLDPSVPGVEKLRD